LNKITSALQIFDNGPGRSDILPQSYVPVDGKIQNDIRIRNAKKERLEEYFKWQFIYALIHSGLYAKDYAEDFQARALLSFQLRTQEYTLINPDRSIAGRFYSSISSKLDFINDKFSSDSI